MCMNNPFELNVVFRFTPQGIAWNQNTGLINARLLRNMQPQDNFIVTAFASTDQHNHMMIRFVYQGANGQNTISIMRLATAMRYYRSGWILRSDVRRPENTFPIRSVWRITQAGAANITIRRMIRNPDHNWVVREIYLDPDRHMRMTIYIDNQTSRENGQTMVCRFDIGMLFYWLSEGWIERVDNVSRPSSPEL